jgi:hypothetical protein
MYVCMYVRMYAFVCLFVCFIHNGRRLVYVKYSMNYAALKLSATPASCGISSK